MFLAGLAEGQGEGKGIDEHILSSDGEEGCAPAHVAQPAHS